MVDQDLRFVRINELLAAIDGASVEAHIGRTVREMVPELANRLELVLRRVLETGDAVSDILIMGVTPRDPKAEKFWLGSYHPFNGPDGAVVGVTATVHDVTARKHMEEKLKASEARYRSLVEASPSAIMAIRNGRFIFTNSAGARLLGFLDPEEVVGLEVMAVVAPGSREHVAEWIKRLEGGQSNPQTEIELLRHDGSTVVAESTSIAIHLPDGPAVLLIAQDITERKQTETRLRMMEFSIEHSLDRVAWLGPDGRFLYANEAACEEMGYSREEMLSMTVSDLDPLYSPELWAEHYEKLKKRGHMRTETQHISKDGQIHFLEVSANRLVFHGTEFLCSFGRDITERKQAQDALRESEARYRTLVEHAPDGVFLVDATTGRFLDCNPQGLEMFGYTREEMLSFTPIDFSPPLAPDGRPVTEVLQETLESLTAEKQVVFEWVHLHADGHEVPCELRVVLLPSAGRSVFRASMIDITERKRAEEALLASRDEARRLAGRLLSAQEEERRRLARELHDDYAQRLASLAMDVAMLEREGGKLPAEVRRELERIRARLRRLADDVGQMSRRLHPSILDDLGLTKALESECAALSKRSGITCGFVAEGVAEPVPKDVALTLYRITQEGLRNVEKHSVAVSAHVKLTCTKGEALLAIEDSGRGFDVEAAQREPGLGLASMRERASLRQGSFSVTSAPGQGTRIEVRVPLAEGNT